MTTQGWLVSNGTVIAAAEVAVSRSERNRGLLGRTSFDGAMVLPHTRWVHTVGMRFPIDVAHLGPDGTVVHVEPLRRNRSFSKQTERETRLLFSFLLKDFPLGMTT